MYNDPQLGIGEAGQSYSIIYLCILDEGVEVSDLASLYFLYLLPSSPFFLASLSIYYILSTLYLIKLLYYINLIYLYIIVISITTNNIPYYFLLYNTNTRSSLSIFPKISAGYKVTVLLSILLLTERTARIIKYDPSEKTVI